MASLKIPAAPIVQNGPNIEIHVWNLVHQLTVRLHCGFILRSFVLWESLTRLESSYFSDPVLKGASTNASLTMKTNFNSNTNQIIFGLLQLVQQHQDSRWSKISFLLSKLLLKDSCSPHYGLHCDLNIKISQIHQSEKSAPMFISSHFFVFRYQNIM